MNAPLHALAEAAGIEIRWKDVHGNPQTVSDESLRAVLAALDLPATSPEEIAQSLGAIRAARSVAPPLVTADQDRPVTLLGKPGPFQFMLENGHCFEGDATDAGDGYVRLPPIHDTGYHRLAFEGQERTVAVAPEHGFTLDAAGHERKLWGLAVQLYALRRRDDGGIGDFLALGRLARLAAGHGADALAISPVHAQFSVAPERFSPYSPSNRSALNVLHIARSGGPEEASLIDWPRAASAKLAALRAAYEQSHDHDALAAFRRETGERIIRHALFEALQAALASGNDFAKDWRNWPEAYRDPENPAVARFLVENTHEVNFHLWLQFRAERELQAAQQAAREAGMRIGLIADLAVGTNHAGSESWIYQNQVLRGLEIGAPPDAINREGQSWGITALSPHGLRASGYGAFIEMLRGGMRHAGGVRIDHIMGLTRLWVIPIGVESKHGAYLKFPAQDLLRLVALESQRHRAVVIGEDLGTLPEGLQERLSRAAIAGMRVLWFERTGAHFTPPAAWTRTAVAMTTTHDLPTVAGWWQGNDIAWRERLGMAGDSMEQREEDRAELWMAFRDSGATTAPIPPADEPAAAVDAACAHIGRAASMLALLPIEDALALPEQPNLPGTQDEHPNWRRRLPGTVEEIMERPEVANRLAALDKARRGA